ncbi:SacI homology domain-containing protein [Gilbertella persicaria]|uniref:SacI homology domain-containing protein n=1 Tax=Gilbertella persicaria TaxID=101096 RepID=UPI00221E88D4|nr:SacI homology domain-containing protein [Gilbertella persicaria]KAI8058923.1 SacI homology domain-containing protein [Gilbertella persicaria]
MNQDAQIFNDNQQYLHDQYLSSHIPEIPTKKEDIPINTPEKKESLNWAHPRFCMSQFQLYETKTRYYLVGTNEAKQRYRVLQIHRTNPTELVVIEDDVLYTEQEKTRLLKMIEDGNLSVGGLQLSSMRIYGIVGFVRFTQGWYMIFITKRRQVAMLGGHYIYHIDETRLVPIGLGAKIDKNSDEARYVATFQNIDLAKNFYFSYTYDITNSLQNNLTQPPLANKQDTDKDDPGLLHNDMFVWNHYLLSSGFKNLDSRSGWVLPLIYGFVDQAKISVFGRSIMVTLIARRSRYFAGARFLKRGVNDKGFVANDVETEQIVADMSTTSFHSTDYLHGNPRYTSYVQHRGSIPLIWSQDTTNMSPKPPIELNVVDPFFSAAALHFENLFQRYGTPCIVLNLIKQKEKTKRESILGKEFAECISYLNQFLPNDKQIKYVAWDMSRASKSHDQDVIGFLEKIADDTMETTGFFQSGIGMDTQRQHGVLRTNCIDCLDRTNAAQFLMGKCALGHQLYVLGVIASPKIDFDSDAVNIFTEMYHDHGDTIALQYGGSHLVNTMETYRKINQWTSHPRDMIESIRRFYANAFSDADKQDAINLFLGNFVTKDGQPMLWELSSDYHLHNQHPLEKTVRRDYRYWYKKKVLEDKQDDLDPERFAIPKQFRVPAVNPDASDLYQGHWVEYYNHQQLTSLDSHFTFNMNGTLKYRPLKISAHSKEIKELTKAEALDMSPFTVRASKSSSNNNSTQSKEKVEPENAEKTNNIEKIPAWTIEGITQHNLEPSVTLAEHKEYKR